MAKFSDKTEDLKDAVRAAALLFDYTESKIAAILASFIMHKPPQRSPFTKAALKRMESINELEHFIVKHRKDYIYLHRTTEQERDNIEHEVSFFVKACKDQIDIFKNRIHDEDKNINSTRWLSMRDDSSCAAVGTHKHGVVLILCERQIVEMSARNHLMYTPVLQQAQQIEHLYEQAVVATKNVEQGNKALAQAIKRNSSSRAFLVCAFIFHSLS